MKLNKSIIWGIPVVLLAVILHYVIFIIADGWKLGLTEGTIWAIGILIASFVATLIYNFVTKVKEKWGSGYIIFLTYSIILVVVFKIYMEWIYPNVITLV